MKNSPALPNTLLAAVFLGCALFAAIAAAADDPDRDTPLLIRMKPDPNAIWLTARLDGAIEVRNGCVYVIAKQSKVPVLAIWPSSYRLLKSKGKAEGVIDSLTGRSVKFGVDASFGGGDAKHVPAAMLEAPIPPACSGERGFAYFSEN